MLVFIIGLIIVVALLLVLVILAQNPKGGLSSQFGGSGTSNLIGVKKTTDLLENITWTLAIGLMVLTLSLNFLTEKPGQGYTSPNIERAQEQSTLPEIEIPAEDDTNTSTDDAQLDQGTLDDLTGEEDQ